MVFLTSLRAFKLLLTIIKAKSEDPVVTPHHAVSDPSMYCLSIFNKWDDLYLENLQNFGWPRQEHKAQIQ